MTEPPILWVEDLRFAYGDIVALDGISLEVPPGRIGLVGANGAGKTTLLKLLLGILQPATGRTRVLGHSSARDALEVRSRVGWMPESDCLPPDQTAADFLGYAAELGGLPVRSARQRASDVLGLVGLHEERFRFMGEFSTGMKQRTKLAQAIVHDPELVLLDEPTAGLDPEGRTEMLELRSDIDELATRYPDIRLLFGCELNIGPDGMLDYDEEFRSNFEWGVASVHSHFDLDQAQQTDRILKAIADPSVKAIGHLTGRYIGRRPGIDLDVDAVLEGLAEADVALEVNGALERLDAPATIVRKAVSRGVKLVISTDSHHVSELKRMAYGVASARRGWATKGSVANTMEAESFIAWATRDRS